jgi:hypothetical protein
MLGNPGEGRGEGGERSPSHMRSPNRTKTGKNKAKPGLTAETLKLEGGWKANIRKSMQAPKAKG